VNRKNAGEIETQTAFEYITVAKARAKGDKFPWQLAMKDAGIEVENGAVYLLVSIPENTLSNLTISYDPSRAGQI
jgi:hypothetical protein